MGGEDGDMEGSKSQKAADLALEQDREVVKETRGAAFIGGTYTHTHPMEHSRKV